MERIKVICIVGTGLLWITLPVFAVGPTTAPAGATTAPAPAEASANSSKADRRSRRGRNRTDAVVTTQTVIASSDPFAILQTRSIFVKGNQNIASASSSPAANSGGRTGSMVGRPESSLVFNGVTTVDDEPQALVEDLSTHAVNTVKAGDGIAGGKVSSITFDGLTYEVNGQTKRVALGESFDGSVPTSGGSTVAGSTPTTMPAAGSSGLSSDDIVARLKAKRAAEAGGK